MSITIPRALASIAIAAAAVAQAEEAQNAPPQLPHCTQPLASVMIGRLQCKAANCNNGNQPAGGNGGIAALIQMAQAAQGGVVQGNVTGIADGIKDVLTTALTETGCFAVQDREQMDEIAEELKRAGKTVQTEQAEFLISGAVTQIDVSTENKSFGGGWIPVVGSIGSKTQRAAVALDMRLVNVNTAKVVASKRASASTESSSMSIGAAGAIIGGGGIGGFGGAFSSLKGTNLEAVTRDALAQSVVFLVDAVRQAKGIAPVTSTAN